jgi:hypothetical protein
VGPRAKELNEVRRCSWDVSESAAIAALFAF